ncbi:MAG TPA: sigma-70 family RNA polymerase sigma factor [Actinophytocola sp.]|nr:sigma-70 family RNA polymerase sigma factor [Actinophytocola sp.]
MATVPAEVEGPSDAELIDEVRRGTVSAYGSLYERHVASAYNLARQLSRSPAEADDLVSEAFAKVLDTLRAGRGPDSAFRAYLLTALRHTAYDKTRKDRRIELSDDVETAGGAALAEPFSDTAVAGLERSLAAQAFARLPERWQAVLWHTEVEGQSPAEVAPILGLTPNGVSALAYRAREGLRQAYLQVHLAETTESRCRATAERLGAWTRAGLAKREKAQVETHLDECERCRALAAELADVNGAMRGFVAPLVLGIGTVGYLASAAASKGSVLAAAGAAGAAGGAAGAAGGAAGGAGGAAGGAAGAATSLPRQFVGVAASSVAMVAAIAIGLTSGGTNQEIPAAAPPPPAQEQPPPAQDPPPAQNPPPAAPPEEPPAEPPAPEPPAPEPPAEDPPAEDPPPAQPPGLTATTPTSSIGLVAGGEPAELPITVTNSGGTVSEPVTATLNLPPGVTAQAAPAGFAPTPLLRLDAPRPGVAGTVDCPGGVGTVTCTSRAGLRPGESVTLLFRLVAAEGSRGGEVTGVVTAGASVNVRVSVRVDVTTPPPVVLDGVEVTASAEWFGLLPGLWLHPELDVRVENTGTSSRPVTVIVDPAGQLEFHEQDMNCTVSMAATVCTTTAELAPGEDLELEFDLDLWAAKSGDESDRVVLVRAKLGTATDSAEVTLNDWPWPPQQPTEPPTPPDPPTPPSSPPAPPSSPAPSSPPGQEPPSATPPPSDPPHRPPAHDRPPTGAPPSPTPSSPAPSEPVPPSSPEPPPEPGGLGGLLEWLLGGGGRG